MRKNEAKFITKFFSEKGTKKYNNDYFGYVALDNSAIWIIADGYGENENGSIASKLVVEKIMEHFILNPIFSNKNLKDMIDYANFHIQRKQIELNLEGLIESSVLIVISNYNSYLYASVGNCRFYHIRDGYVIHKSREDTLTQSMYEEGFLKEEDMKNHRQRNDFLQILGDGSKIKINKLSDPEELEENDKLILCTIGFWENIDKEKLEKEIVNSENVGEVNNKLKNIIENLNKIEIENNTFSIVDIKKVAKNTGENVDKRDKNLKIILFLMFLVGLILSLNLYFVIKEKIINKKVRQYEIEIDKNIEEKKFNNVIEYLGMIEVEYNKLGKGSKNIIGFLTNGAAREEKVKLKKLKLSENVQSVKKLKESFSDINSGNENFKKENYEKALQNYNKVKYILEENEYKNDEIKIENIIFALDDRIEATKELIKAKEQENLGDMSYNLKAYNDAIEMYENAKNIYVKNVIDNKIMEIDKKIKEIKKIEKTLTTEAIHKENQGDIYFFNNLEKSKEEYTKSKEIYKTLGDVEKTREIENKITDINNKIMTEEVRAKTKLEEALKEVMYEDIVAGIGMLIEVKEIYKNIGDENAIKNVDNFITKAKDYIKFEEKKRKMIENERNKIEKEVELKEKEIKKEQEKMELVNKMLEKITTLENEAVIKNQIFLNEVEGDNLYREKKYKDAEKFYKMSVDKMEEVIINNEDKERIIKKHKKVLSKINKKWWEFWK